MTQSQYVKGLCVTDTFKPNYGSDTDQGRWCAHNFRRLFGNADAPEPQPRDRREFCKWLFAKDTEDFKWWAYEDTVADLESYVKAYTAHFLDNGSGKNPIRLRLQGMVTWYFLWNRKSEQDRFNRLYQDSFRTDIYEVLDGWANDQAKPTGRADAGLASGSPEAIMAQKCMELCMFVFGSYHDTRLSHSLTEYEQWLMDPASAPDEFRNDVTMEVEDFFSNVDDASRLTTWAKAGLACRVGLQQPEGSTIFRLFNSSRATAHFRPSTGKGKLMGTAFATAFICTGGERSVAIIRDNTVPFDDYYAESTTDPASWYLAGYFILKFLLVVTVVIFTIMAYEKAHSWFFQYFWVVSVADEVEVEEVDTHHEDEIEEEAPITVEPVVEVFADANFEHSEFHVRDNTVPNAKSVRKRVTAPRSCTDAERASLAGMRDNTVPHLIEPTAARRWHIVPTAIARTRKKSDGVIHFGDCKNSRTTEVRIIRPCKTCMTPQQQLKFLAFISSSTLAAVSVCEQ